MECTWGMWARTPPTECISGTGILITTSDFESPFLDASGLFLPCSSADSSTIFWAISRRNFSFFFFFRWFLKDGNLTRIHKNIIKIFSKINFFEGLDILKIGEWSRFDRNTNKKTEEGRNVCDSRQADKRDFPVPCRWRVGGTTDARSRSTRNRCTRCSWRTRDSCSN